MRFNRFAKGRPRPTPGVMNKTEASYGAELELRKRAGEVEWYAYEGLKLKLAANTFYTPDFAVMLSSGELEMHEVKGFWEDDARVKIKVAAELFPFRFLAMKPISKKNGGGFSVERFGNDSIPFLSPETDR